MIEVVKERLKKLKDGQPELSIVLLCKTIYGKTNKKLYKVVISNARDVIWSLDRTLQTDKDFNYKDIDYTISMNEASLPIALTSGYRFLYLF